MRGQVQCASFDDHDDDGIPNEYDADYVAGSEDDAAGLDSEIIVLIALLVFLMAVISVAMIAKQLAEERQHTSVLKR